MRDPYFTYSDDSGDQTIAYPDTDECVFEPVLAKRRCYHNKKVGITPTLS